MENFLSGFFGAALGFAGSLYVYWHSQKTRYKLELLEKIDLLFYIVRYEHSSYDNTFTLVKAHILSLQTATTSLMSYCLNSHCIDKAWHDFKGMNYHHKKEGVEYMSLPDNADEALKRLKQYRDAIQST